MNRIARGAMPLVLLSAVATAAIADGTPVTPTALAYPPTRSVDTVDDYFGRKIADPYRWLEDLESPGTAAWVTAQNKVTFAYLDTLPKRAEIRERLTKLWDYQRTTVPVRVAGQIWFQQNSGLQRQAPLYRSAAPNAKPELVLDPNTLSPDGSVQMAQWAPSPDGRFLAYTLAPGGSDVQDARVRDLASGADLPDVVRNVKFTGLEWTKDGKGFFYSRFRGTEAAASFADAGEVHQVWYHTIDGKTPDRLVFERPDFPKEFTGATVSDDGRWLYLSTASGSLGNRLWIADLGAPTAPDLAVKPLVVAAEEDAFHTPLGVIGRTLYLHTTYGAPRGRIVAVEVGEPDRAEAERGQQHEPEQHVVEPPPQQRRHRHADLLFRLRHLAVCRRETVRKRGDGAVAAEGQPDQGLAGREHPHARVFLPLRRGRCQQGKFRRCLRRKLRQHPEERPERGVLPDVDPGGRQDPPLVAGL